MKYTQGRGLRSLVTYSNAIQCKTALTFRLTNDVGGAPMSEFISRSMVFKESNSIGSIKLRETPVVTDFSIDSIIRLGPTSQRFPPVAN